MPGLSIQKTLVAIIIGLLLIAVGGLSENWFGPKQVIIDKPVKLTSDTLPVRIVSEPFQQLNDKKSYLSDSTKFQLENNTTPLGDPDIKSITANIDDGAMADKKGVQINVINKTVKAKFAVLAVTDEKKDNQLAAVFVEWLRNYGTASNMVLLDIFIEKGYFNRILEGESSDILTTNVYQAVDYVCLIRASMKYTTEGAIYAQGVYDFIIIDTKTGSIVDSKFNYKDGASGISEIKAKERVEEFLYKFLSNRKITI